MLKELHEKMRGTVWNVRVLFNANDIVVYILPQVEDKNVDAVVIKNTPDKIDEDIKEFLDGIDSTVYEVKEFNKIKASLQKAKEEKVKKKSKPAKKEVDKSTNPELF